MRFIVAIVVAVAAFPCVANAAPVYLKCQLDAGARGGMGGEDLLVNAPMDVTLNEETGTVSYVLPKIDRAITVRGIFTADRVLFNGFTIDRTNLEFQRDMSSLQAPGRTPIVDHGRCTLVEVERAF